MNCVTLTGILKAKVDKEYRDLVYDTPFSDEGMLEVRHIKVKYWTKQHQTRLSLIPNETRVLIHGHLEEHEIFGTILLAEELEVIS